MKYVSQPIILRRFAALLVLILPAIIGVVKKQAKIKSLILYTFVFKAFLAAEKSAAPFLREG